MRAGVEFVCQPLKSGPRPGSGRQFVRRAQKVELNSALKLRSSSFAFATGCYDGSAGGLICRCHYCFERASERTAGRKVLISLAGGGGKEAPLLPLSGGQSTQVTRGAKAAQISVGRPNGSNKERRPFAERPLECSISSSPASSSSSSSSSLAAAAHFQRKTRQSRSCRINAAERIRLTCCRSSCFGCHSSVVGKLR